MVGLLAGLVLMAMAFARLGRYVRYLPVSVIEGFTAGIAVVIALQQFPRSPLGVADASGEKVWAIAADAVHRFASHPQIAPLLVSLSVATLMLLGARWRPRVPFSLIGVVIVTVLAQALDLQLTSLGHFAVGPTRTVTQLRGRECRQLTGHRGTRHCRACGTRESVVCHGRRRNDRQ